MRLNSSSLGNRDTANRRKTAMTDWIRGTACVVAAGFAGSVLGVGCFFLIDAVGLANQDAFDALDRRVLVGQNLPGSPAFSGEHQRRIQPFV